MIEKLDLSDLKYQFEPEEIDFKEVNYIMVPTELEKQQ